MKEPIQIMGAQALLRLAAVNIALWLVSKGLAEALAPWGLGIYVGALYIITPAFVMPYYMGIIWVCAWGLWVDTSAVWPFGLSSLIWAAAFTAIAFVRDRLPWPAFREALWLSPLLNTILIGATGILAKPSGVDWGVYGPLLTATWFVSTTAVLVLAWPVLGLQLRALSLSTLAQEDAQTHWS